MKLYNGKWNEIFDELSPNHIEGLNQFDRLVFHTELFLELHTYDYDIVNFMRKNGSYDHAFTKRVKQSCEKLIKLGISTVSVDFSSFTSVPKSYCFGIKDQGSDNKLKIMFAVAKVVDFFKRCHYKEKKIKLETLWFKENWANVPNSARVNYLEKFTIQYLDELQKSKHFTYEIKNGIITFHFTKKK